MKIDNIKKRILPLLSVLFFLSAMYSCDDNFMDKQPLDVISEEDVWNDINLSETFINQIYASMRTGIDYSPRLNIISDEAYGRGRDYVHLINRGELTPSNNTGCDYWEHYYDIITACNIFLEKAKGNEALAGDKLNRMIGEIKFFRGYCYFRLTAFYGGVPLITKTFSLNDDYLLARNNYEECINFAIAELDEAASLLPLSYTGDDLGRVTKGAALAIKARALLYAASPLNNTNNDKSKWQKASDAAKAVIDLNLYSLYPDYKQLFLEPFNEEIIWCRPFNNEVKVERQIELWYYPNGSGGYGQIFPIQNVVDAYETLNGKLPADDPAYDPQNPYVNRDPRFYASILYDGAPWQDREIETFLPGGKDSNEGNEGWNATYSGYYPRKFIDESIIKPTSTNVGSTDWIFCRYGEILLNYAEAQFYLGNEDMAREYLNMVRSRPSVQMPPVTESGEELEKRIQNERRVELFFEEHRFFDVRRWKIAMVTENEDAVKVEIIKDLATGKKTYTYKPFEARAFFEQHYLIPIPQSEIDKNSKLEQNPGY
ncbi:MAG: RagB/SusD family nutrient uptake outer membrane protein [Bacteroidales bacterium]